MNETMTPANASTHAETVGESQSSTAKTAGAVAVVILAAYGGFKLAQAGWRKLAEKRAEKDDE